MKTYNQIGVGYDLTRSADPEILKILASLIGLHKEGSYLDVGCGTGNYTVEFARLGGRWNAFDHLSESVRTGYLPFVTSALRLS